MTIGVILVAAGITDAVHHFRDQANRWWLGGGTATYLVGHAVYRALLKSGRTIDRLAGAACAVLVGALASFAGWAAMAAVVSVLIAIATVDHHRLPQADTGRPGR